MDYRISTLEAPEQHAQAAALYRTVFGYQDPTYGVNPRLLSTLVANGGSVVGALDADDRVVAFAYGYCGTDGREFYHFSQAAVVAPELQGQGLGRRLKQGQREVALRHGMTRMRWTYDPLNTRNAHFNLDVLGARGRWFRADLFGPGTDRVVVEWDLTRTDRPAVSADAVEVPVSADLRKAFEKGFVAVSCVRDVYLFEPGDD